MCRAILITKGGHAFCMNEISADCVCVCGHCLKFWLDVVGAVVVVVVLARLWQAEGGASQQRARWTGFNSLSLGQLRPPLCAYSRSLPSKLAANS